MLPPTDESQFVAVLSDLNRELQQWDYVMGPDLIRFPELRVDEMWMKINNMVTIATSYRPRGDVFSRTRALGSLSIQINEDLMVVNEILEVLYKRISQLYKATAADPFQRGRNVAASSYIKALITTLICLRNEWYVVSMGLNFL